MSRTFDLAALGWTDFFQAQLEADAQPGLEPGRVAAAHKGGFELLTAKGTFLGQVRGKLRLSGEGAPAVGDWVRAALREGEKAATIHQVLRRRTAFARQTPGGYEGERQVLAANVDVVFLVTGLDQDFSIRRLERLLALARDSGAEPVLVLTKKDVDDPAAGRLAAAQAAAGAGRVHAVSALTGEGVAALEPYFQPHRTVALLGSSGVGKSTLANVLLGEALLEVGEVRADGRGRHTTVRRELRLLPQGGLILDTPGLREVQLSEEARVQEAFEDVDALAQGCRFRDCVHRDEPGCAVRQAADEGRLASDRYGAFLRLSAERAAKGRPWKAAEKSGTVAGGRQARVRDRHRR